MLGVTIIQGIGRNSSMIMKIKELYAVHRSKFQEIIIAELEEFGLSLVLDGYVQSTQLDEFIYHESLVHPPMILHPNPARVLIIGGGEGATLREVLKHNTVTKAVMVDIDGDVVELSKKYLYPIHQGSFFDKRAEIVIEDGKRFIEHIKSGSFDIVILDLTDPYSSDIAKQLYTTEFYRKIYNILTDDGIMVTQAGSSFFYRDVYMDVYQAIKAVFSYVQEYQVWIPSFGYSCNFILGSKKYDPKLMKPEDINEILKNRNVTTRFFNGYRYLSFIYGGIY